MLIRLGFVVAGLTIAAPAHAQSELEDGFAGALRGCEEWVLNPVSWAEGTAPFIAAVGLGNKMGLVDTIDEAALPPQALRVANHYWRINSTMNAGYILVVSDKLPMCHITGGGSSDLQPIVQAVLEGGSFKSRWEKVSEGSRQDMTTSVYKNRQEPSFSIVVSRATKQGGRQDRIQVLVTATLKMRG
jgi:hypothetical protein